VASKSGSTDRSFSLPGRASSSRAAAGRRCAGEGNLWRASHSAHLHSSYDKANRSSAASFRGRGWRRTAHPGRGQAAGRLPVRRTSTRSARCGRPRRCRRAADAGVPVLCRQTDFIRRSRARQPVNIRRASSRAGRHAAGRAEGRRRRAAPTIFLVSRTGVRSAITTWYSDMRSLAIMAQTGLPRRVRCQRIRSSSRRAGQLERGQREFVPVPRARCRGGRCGRTVHGNAPAAGCGLVGWTQRLPLDAWLLLERWSSSTHPSSAPARGSRTDGPLTSMRSIPGLALNVLTTATAPTSDT